MAKYQCTCIICSNEFVASRAATKTCSTVCRGKNQIGTNNPNFGNKWTAEQREAGSRLKKEQFRNNPNYAYECGKANRGLTFSKERIQSMHGHREKASYIRTHSEESKNIIGTKSKEKFTPEFKEKFRKQMEETGHWVKLEDKDPYDIYYKEANWIESMIEFFDDDSTQILNEYGMFSHKNTKGWVRDHIVPRMVGYEFSLPPRLMRHPANLQFISHADNVKKGFSDRKLTKKEKFDTVKQLFEKIMQYTKPWKEHDWCIEYIRRNLK